jgi:hypothetical protein
VYRIYFVHIDTISMWIFEVYFACYLWEMALIVGLGVLFDNMQHRNGTRKKEI